MQEKINVLKQLLSEKKNIVITVHKGPDGDAMGSALGLYNVLIHQGYNVNIITPNDYASFLHWMPGNENVIVFTEESEKAKEITKEAELIFLLDFGQISRLDAYGDIVSHSSAKKVMIDHHQQPDESVSDILFSDVTACATAQIVFEIIDSLNWKSLINKEVFVFHNQPSYYLYTSMLYQPNCCAFVVYSCLVVQALPAEQKFGRRRS